MAKLPWHPSRTLFAFVLFALLTLLALIASPAIDAQAGVGAISGTISAAPGVPVNGARVSLCYVSADNCEPVYSQDISPLGTYTFTDLWNPDYYVRFEPIWETSDYFAIEYFQNVPDWQSAQLVPVTPGETTTGIDAVLEAEATISGTITAFGEPVGENYVGLQACRVVADNCVPVGQRIQVNPDGTYFLRALPSGTLYLWIDARTPFLSEYYGQSDDFAGATPIILATGEHRTGLDFALTPDVSITGRAVDSNGAPVAGVRVSACEAFDTSWCYNWQPWTETRTDANGDYAIYGLPHQPMYVEFEGGIAGSGPSAPQYWPGMPSLRFAELITPIRRAPITDINATILPAARIGGILTNAAGDPLPYIEAYYCWWNGSVCDIAKRETTNSEGEWQAYGVYPGTYRVYFEDWGTPPSYEPEFYVDVSTFESATDIVAAPGAVITDVNAQLAAAAGPYLAHGTVTDGATGLSGVIVDACHPLFGDCDGQTTTDATGAYTISVPVPGFRTLKFTDPTGVHLTQVYGGNPQYPQNLPIMLRSGPPLEGINIVMAKGVRFTGTIFDNTGAPATNMIVEACPWTDIYWNCTLGKSVETGAGNTYSIGNLPPGDYALVVSDAEYHTLFRYAPYIWENTSTMEETATKITLASGEVHDVTIVVHKNSRLGGQVTNTQGTPIPNVGVTVCAPDVYWCMHFWYSMTDENGRWEYVALSPGEYRIGFDASNQNFIPEYYDNHSTIELATSIILTESQILSSVNAQLTRYGSIAGRVTNEAGEPLYGIAVEACATTAPECWMNPQAYTDVTGNYVVGGLRAGTYRLRFSDEWTGYRGEFYNNMQDAAAAQQIQVPSETALTGFDAVLTHLDATPMPTPPTATPTQTPTPTSPAPTATSPAPSATPTSTPPAPNPDAVAELEVNPDEAAEIDVLLGNGRSIHVEVPAGAVTETITLDFMTFDPPNAGQPGFKVAGMSFGILVRNAAANGFVFAKPITLTIHYADADVAGMDEETLMLRFYDPETDSWSDDGIEFVSRNSATNTLVVRIHHLTDFALGDTTVFVFLPSVQQK